MEQYLRFIFTCTATLSLMPSRNKAIACIMYIHVHEYVSIKILFMTISYKLQHLCIIHSHSYQNERLLNLLIT